MVKKKTSTAKNLKADLVVIGGGGAGMAPMKNLIADYNVITQIDNQLVKSITSVRDVADALSVEISQIAIRDNKYTLVCEADSYLAFRAFIEEIGTFSEFENIVAPPDGYPYNKAGTISLEIKVP